MSYNMLCNVGLSFDKRISLIHSMTFEFSDCAVHTYFEIANYIDCNLPVTKESTKEFDGFVVKVRTDLKRKSKCKCSLEITGVVAQKGVCGGMWRLVHSGTL